MPSIVFRHREFWGDEEGVVDHSEQTITFKVPYNAITNGQLLGHITELSAITDTIYFQVAGFPGVSFDRRLGDLAGFATGDFVYVDNNIKYELIIELYDRIITELEIEGHAGVIDQEARTITFTIANHLLDNGRFLGHITKLEGDGVALYFKIADFPDQIFERALGELTGFSTGDLVSVRDGIEFTLIIIPSH